MARYLFVLLFLTAGILSVYKLTESPPTWYDEGLVIQPAINLARHGSMAVQFAPTELSSAWFISSGFPVIYPISLMFKWLGISLGAARLVMVFYIILLVMVFYWLAKKTAGNFYVFLSTALLVTFAPLYGNGKNVLGEVPGLFWLLASLLCLAKIEAAGPGAPRRLYVYYILGGATTGLCLATKPIFLLLCPALFLAFIIKRRQIIWNWALLGAFAAAALIPLLFWLYTQFGGGHTLFSTLGWYSNPYSVSSLWGTVSGNLKRFALEANPIYFAIMMVVWLSSIFVRIRRRQSLSFVELVSVFFAGFIFFAYLRTAGWYRYFFPAQVVAFLYFPAALFQLAEAGCRRFTKWLNYVKIKYLTITLLFLVIIFQAYQVTFRSWVADYYQSQRTELLSDWFSRWPSGQSVLLYNSPELVIFLPTDNYYQYLALTDTFILGREQLPLIAGKNFDRIIVKQVDLNNTPALFAGYQPVETIDRYQILAK